MISSVTMKKLFLIACPLYLFFYMGDAILSSYYVFELDTKIYSNIILARMNPAHDSKDDFDANNDYLWNQTSDLTFDASKRLYKITGWGEYGQKRSIGEWAVYNDA